jgi:hypothetical protein
MEAVECSAMLVGLLDRLVAHSELSPLRRTSGNDESEER